MTHDHDAERSVLAAMMLDPAALSGAAGMLERSDFDLEACGKVFAALVHLHAHDAPADLVTLSAALRESGHLEAVGGPEALSRVLESASTAANWRYHAGILKRHRRARDVRRGALALAEGVGLSASPEAIQEAARRLADAARPHDAGRGPSHVSVGLSALFTNGRQPAVPFGLECLAALDLNPSHLAVVAARPGQGKTAFLGGVALAAAKAGWDVLFISLEMPALEIQQRLIAGLGSIPLGIVKECSDTMMVKVANELSALPVWVEDGNEEPRLTLDLEGIGALVGMFSEVDRGDKPRLVLVDYLQYVHTRKRYERRHEAVGHVCRELKRFAKDHAVPMLVAAQLNRSVEQRGKDARPQMSDLAESSDIEKNADKILFIHREEPTGQAFVKVAKNRQGACWTSELRYIGELCRFDDLVPWS